MNECFEEPFVDPIKTKIEHICECNTKFPRPSVQKFLQFNQPGSVDGGVYDNTLLQLLKHMLINVSNKENKVISS